MTNKLSMHNNSIMELINLKSNTFEIINSETNGQNKVIFLEKILIEVYCSKCNSRAYSKGKEQRTIVHPVLLDGYLITLKVTIRRWKCPKCNHQFNDDVEFASKHKQTTNYVHIQLCNLLKDLNKSFSSVANELSLSDFTVKKYFNKLVNPKRATLTDILCIDEVFTNIDDKSKYSIVLLDFYTNMPIDLVKSRRQDTLNPYLLSIPLSERKKVKYLISDMYNTYINLCGTYFPNAVTIIDSFHVISWINKEIIKYIANIKSSIRKEINELNEIKPLGKNERLELNRLNYRLSLLTRDSWVLLKKRSTVEFKDELHYSIYLGQTVNTQIIINLFYQENQNFEFIHVMKELYLSFNERDFNSQDDVREELQELIKLYSKAKLKMFRDFAEMLERYQDGIVNSFTFITYTDSSGNRIQRRLSNGPIEGFNRIVKDLKRLTRGFENFEMYRKRILWSKRNDISINT